MKKFKNQGLKRSKIQVTFQQVKIDVGELNNRIDSIFDILFEETLKTSLNQANGDIPINQTEIREGVNKQICLN